MHTVPLPMHVNKEKLNELFDGKVVLTDSDSIQDLATARFIHLCNNVVPSLTVTDGRVKNWKSDIYRLSRTLAYDFIFSNNVLKLNSIPFDELDSNRVISSNTDTSPPLPEHGKWVKNLIKIISVYGAQNISISVPKTHERLFEVIPGSRACKRVLSPHSRINVVLYEGDSDVNVRSLSPSILLTNKPELWNLYKIQRYGYTFTPSHSGFYRMIERSYEIP